MTAKKKVRDMSRYRTFYAAVNLAITRNQERSHKRQMRIFVSACLAGESVRYDGKSKKVENRILKKWIKEKIAIPFCPEVAGGLGIPRNRAEIVKITSAGNINDKFLIKDVENNNVTDIFVRGAELSVKFAKDRNIKLALLKDGSPSCGSTYIYDGSFRGVKVKGSGILSYFFDENDILCFNENQIQQLNNILNKSYNM